MPNFDPANLMLQQKSRLISPDNIFPIFHFQILVSLCELYPPFAVLSFDCFELQQIACIQNCMLPYYIVSENT